MVVAAAAIPMTTFDVRSIVKGFISSKDKLKRQSLNDVIGDRKKLEKQFKSQLHQC